MFAGFGGALKNLGSKAESLFEKKTDEVEDVANQKKQLASEVLEEQAKKTGDAIWSTKSELEGAVVGGAVKAKHTAIDTLDEEFGKAEKVVESTVQQTSDTVDTKLKEADKFIDEKRDQVKTAVQDTSKKAVDTKEAASASVLDKAKDLLNF